MTSPLATLNLQDSSTITSPTSQAFSASSPAGLGWQGRQMKSLLTKTKHDANPSLYSINPIFESISKLFLNCFKKMRACISSYQIIHSVPCYKHRSHGLLGSISQSGLALGSLSLNSLSKGTRPLAGKDFSLQRQGHQGAVNPEARPGL